MTTGREADPGTGPWQNEPASGGDDLSLLKPLNVILEARRSFLLWPLVLVALAAGYTSWAGAPYFAHASLTPTTDGGSEGRLTSLAAQLGLSVGAARGGLSLTFYAEVLRSRELLVDLATTRYRVVVPNTDSVRVGSYVDLLAIEGDSDSERIQNATELLRARVRVTEDPEAGIVTIRAPAPWPDLAEQLVRRAVDLVGDFNLSKRQTQAREEREFVQERLENAEQALVEAEAELLSFLEANRRYTESPELSFEAARLQRGVDFRQSLYTTLARSYEQARIEEVRNTPVITLIDRPEGSARRDLPLVRNMMVAAAFGVALAFFVAFAAAYARSQAQLNPIDYQQYRSLRQQLISDIFALPRSIVRRFRR